MRIAVLDAPSRPSRLLGVQLQGNSAGAPQRVPAPLDHCTDRTAQAGTAATGWVGMRRRHGPCLAIQDWAGTRQVPAAKALPALRHRWTRIRVIPSLPRAAITGSVPKPLEHDPPARMRTSALARVMVQVVSCGVSCLGSCGAGACGRSRRRCEADVEPRRAQSYARALRVPRWRHAM